MGDVAGVLTFGLHQRLPYRRLLIVTGVLLLFVLLVSVGEEVCSSPAGSARAKSTG